LLVGLSILCSITTSLVFFLDGQVRGVTPKWPSGTQNSPFGTSGASNLKEKNAAANYEHLELSELQ
jgi:hypothetical protein